MSKKRPARHGRTRSLAVSGWPLSLKVALAIAIPLLLAATLGGLQVRSDLHESANSSSSAQQVKVLRPAVAYLTAAERATVASQDTTGASASELSTALLSIQIEAEQLAEARTTSDLTADERYQIDALLDLSRAIRTASTDSLGPETWIAQLRQLQSGVTQLITTIVNEQINPEPRLELLSQALAGRFSLAMQQALATERTGETGSQDLFEELGVEASAIDRLASALGASEPAIAALRTENAQRAHAIRTSKADLGGAANAYDQYDALITKLMDGIDTQLAESASDARRSALVSGGITLGALLATLLLAYLVSRLLLNPIRKVREGARTVAHEQLPEAVARIRAGHDPGPITPIDVTTHEEVGQLARAVDELHRQAVTLASGEARLRSQVGDMFITLSRRNTSLVNQQLRLIETLEKDEEDPHRLESLFRLDHLAARMRRTADSLLVLADAPTHTSAEDDLTVAAALQAASAGVQDYKRVRVGSATTARISDEAAADVVHLLTELVDNALAYSAPTTTVLVSSTTAASGVTVSVEDAGLGIPERTLADINETLHTGGDVTPDTARRMGLFVVSRLAQRHGVTVSLETNRGGGITATVLLPTRILDVPAAPATPAEPAVPPVRAVAPSSSLPRRTPGPPTEERSLEERLNAAIGLPRRDPGAQVPETAPVPAPAAEAPAEAPAAEAASARGPIDLPTEPETRSVPAPAAWTEPTVASRTGLTTPRAAVDSTADTADDTARGTARDNALDGAPDSAFDTVSDTDQDADRGQPRTAAAYAAVSEAPLSTASASDHLTGDRAPFPPLEDSEAEADTPIFRAVRSAWLSANATMESWKYSEIEAGWAEADRVAETEAPVNAAGLPTRRPGSRLVPGGITKPATAGSRDPEAVRTRLAAHAAGVSRGRAAATTSPDPQPSEESPA
jgi:signal transduction histidine kinase